MGLRSMTPVLGIIDDVDAPTVACLVIVFGQPHRPRVEYINPRKRPLGCRGRLTGMPRLFTELEKFGCVMQFLPDGRLEVRQSGMSSATYPDGVARRWQDKIINCTEVRRVLAGHVISAVRASLKSSAAQASTSLHHVVFTEDGDGHFRMHAGPLDRAGAHSLAETWLSVNQMPFATDRRMIIGQIEEVRCFNRGVITDGPSLETVGAKCHD